MSTTTAATTIVLQLAREILSRHRPSPPSSSSSSRKAEEVPALFGRLAKSLRESTEAHVRTSMVPRRVPPTTTTPTTTTTTTANVITTNDGRIEWRNHFRDAVTASLARCSHDPFPYSHDNTRAPLSSANATYGETPPDTIRTLLAALSSAPYSSNDNNTSSSSSNSRNNSSNSNNSISNSNKNSNNKNNTHRSFEGSFIDAGSGNGIATVCAASTGHFHLCRGVEYSEGRHVLAMRLRDDYIRQCSGRSDNHDNNDDNNNNSNSNNNIDNNDDNENDSVRNQTQIEFTCGDLANETFHGSSLIFANCVVWDASLCSAVGRNIDEARMVGPRLVATISRRFPSPSFDLVDILTLPCNGGEDFTFYVCQKSGYHDLGGDLGSSFALAANDAVVVVGTATSAAATNKSSNTTTAATTTNNNNNNIDHRDSFALSDSQPMRALRREIGLLEELVGISILSGGPNNNNDNTNNEGMAFLAAMGASEPSARVLLDNQDILPHLAKKLLLQSNYHNGDGDAGAGIHGGIINSLATRASSSMALRALSDFPIGRRRIAEDKSVVAALMGSLAVEVKGPCIPGGSSSSSSGSGNKNDHPAIRANVLDVLGQILNDPVGFKSVLGVHSDINALLVNVRRDAKFNGWSDVVESCDEMQTKLGWWDTINLQDLEL